MSVQELHRPRPLGLLKMVQNRQWASLALALATFSRVASLKSGHASA